MVGLYELPAARDDAVLGLVSPLEVVAGLARCCGEGLGEEVGVLAGVHVFAEVQPVLIRFLECPVMGTAFDERDRWRLGLAKDVPPLVTLRAAQIREHLRHADVALAGLLGGEDRIEERCHYSVPLSMIAPVSESTPSAASSRSQSAWICLAVAR